jgi:hypothetical protein
MSPHRAATPPRFFLVLSLLFYLAQNPGKTPDGCATGDSDAQEYGHARATGAFLRNRFTGRENVPVACGPRILLREHIPPERPDPEK